MNKNTFKKPLSTIKGNNIENKESLEINKEFNKNAIANLYPGDKIKITNELFNILLKENFFKDDKFKNLKDRIVGSNLIFNEKDGDLLDFSLRIASGTILKEEENIELNQSIYTYQLKGLLQEKIEVLKTNVSEVYKIIDNDGNVGKGELFNSIDEAKERIKDFLENEYDRNEIDDDLIFSVANFDIQPTIRELKDIKSVIIEDILEDDSNFIDEKHGTLYKHVLFEKIKNYSIDQLGREFFDLKGDNYEFVKLYERKTFEKYINHELHPNSRYYIDYINPLTKEKETSYFNTYENLQNFIYDLNGIKEIGIKIVLFEENSTRIKETFDIKDLVSIYTSGNYINKEDEFNIKLIKE